ncbi:MAG: hypothetical protein ACKO27_00025 [Ilumatobacteraceae bacterium]
MLVLSLLALVPVLVFGLSAVRLPSAAMWRQLLSTRRVGEDVVVASGTAVFLGLWAWFSLSAVAECWAVLRWRRLAGAVPLPELPPGPTGRLRALVRLAVLAGVTISAASAGVDPSSAVAARPTAAAAESTPSTSTLHDASTQSPAGERYHIAARPLRQRPPAASMRDHDHEGRIERPVASSSDIARSSEISPSTMGLPTTREVVSAVMFAAGAVALLDSARRRRLRAAPLGSRPDLPSLAQMRTELMLRRLARDEQMVRLDVALRAVSESLAACGAMMTVAVVGRLGDIRVLPSVQSSAPLPWRSSGDGWWSLPASVTLEELSSHSRTDAPPCPAMLHLGSADDGECFIDLEAVGVLEVVSRRREQLAATMSATLAMSPFLDAARVLTVLGIGDGGASQGEMSVASIDEAIDLAAVLLGDTVTSIGGATTFDRRVSTRGGESFEPVVVVAPGLDPGDTAVLRQLITPGRGIGALVFPAFENAGSPHRLAAGARPVSTRISSTATEQWALREEAGSADIHVLEPCGLRIRPAIVPPAALVEVRDVLKSESTQFDIAGQVVPIDAGRSTSRGAAVPFVEPNWALLVRTLGAVEVVAADGTQVQFDRSKALELVVWLALHRRRPTRGAARAALWDLDVRDATFANVVSEARRALARASMPAAGDEWIPRTLTDSLPLHERVVSDAELLEARVRYAEGLPHQDAVEVLAPGLEVVTGMPFAGSNYLWCDAEGHASAHVLMVVGAATRLAQHHLALGDVEGVFWATGKGLLVLSGHEELVAMRMRAHAGAGDLAGVRDEWERYERALQADPWAASQPSPKLSALRRELLGRVS